MKEELGKLVLPTAGRSSADIQPRPPRSLAAPIFWRASVQSIGCITKPIYVWATSKRFVWGYTVPRGAGIVAEFWKEKMVYCVWGDHQNEEELERQIVEYDKATKTKP